MVKGQDRVLDAGLMDRSFDVTVYIYVGTVLEKQHQSWGLRNMSNEVARWIH